MEESFKRKKPISIYSSETEKILETSFKKPNYKSLVKSPKKEVKFDENINVLTIPNRIQSLESGEIVDWKPTQEPLPPMNSLSENFLLPKNKLRGPLELKVVKKIGAGTYGEVYVVEVKEKVNRIPKYFPKPNRYALKRMIDLERNRAFEYENEIMSIILNQYPYCAPHVLCYFDISIDKEGRYYLLSELMDGDILDYDNELIQNESDKEKLMKKKMKLALDVANQTLAGLKELQKIGLLHRDLKEENLLYKHPIGPTGRVRRSELQIKLGDFGLSCILNSKTLRCGDSPVGTAGYIDPRIILEARKRDKEDIVEVDEIWDETNDIYSLAVIAYQILFGEYVSKVKIKSLKEKDDEIFVYDYEDIYQENNKWIENEISNYGKNSKEAKLLRFILRNTDPFGKKQTIDESIASLK